MALHEFGHVIGLNHPDSQGQSVTAVMNSRTSNTDNLQADDINGARAIYGQPLAQGDTLRAGGRLFAGQSLVSSNRRFRLLYQDDGNLVVYDASGVGQWSTGTVGNANARLLVQSDGNLVIYNGSGQPVWDRFR